MKKHILRILAYTIAIFIGQNIGMTLGIGRP